MRSLSHARRRGPSPARREQSPATDPGRSPGFAAAPPRPRHEDPVSQCQGLHRTCCFGADGVVSFEACTNDPPALAARLQALLREFAQRPDLVDFATANFRAFGDRLPPWITPTPGGKADR